MKTYVLFNGLSGNGTGRETAEKAMESVKGSDLIYDDVTKIESMDSYFADKGEDDTVILCGGDGTLNRFANDTNGMTFPCRVQFFPTGTGNDFWRDVEGKDEPIDIVKYLQNLPSVTVKGKDYLFINGVGYGIDGYCCEVADQIREKAPQSKIDYTGIAVKGLLFHYKPTLATVVVDGKKYEFPGAWLAPTMKGRFYGGGMMPTPAQDRLDPEGKVSVMVMSGAGRLKTLMAFPNIFKGEHVKNKMVTILSGNEISVSFDRPVALQIDGETVLGVEGYSVRSGKLVPAAAKA
ncbi:MAG: diacylglycerol kinase family protein [Clostridia bacterium]|nr:diacylglycerol kinase family protein [Clostridia bacterium]